MKICPIRVIRVQKKCKNSKQNIIKTFTKSIATLITITLPIAIGTINFSLAQTPPPPNGGETPGQGGNTPVGGGAPIAGGIGILLALGVAYGGKKVYDFRKAMHMAQVRKLAE